VKTALAVLLTLAAGGCTERFPVERGEALFSDPGISPSDTNEIACDTCHTTGPETPDHLYAGGSLENVLGRPSLWGGTILDPREAINVCLRSFMRHPDAVPLEPDDPDGLDLLAYLETLGTEPSDPVPFTLPRSLPTSLPPGDPARGAAIYQAGCRECHGAMGTGDGGIRLAPVIPTETREEHGDATPTIIVARIRRGGFYGIGGDMPPFSLEKLSDDDVADILSFMEEQLRP
jgi:thiosulfate dehydrogenase